MEQSDISLLAEFDPALISPTTLQFNNNGIAWMQHLSLKPMLASEISAGFNSHKLKKNIKED